MSVVAALLLVVGVGPSLDPTAPSTVTAADRDLLPSGRTAASVADLWLAEAVSLYSVEGGIGLFDRPAVSSRGWSWTQLRYTLNGIDVTDPGRPGAPLIELPHTWWSSTSYQSFAIQAPTYGWQLTRDPAAPSLRGRLSWGRGLNGPTLVPSGFMDREPATAFGATPERRALANAAEVGAEGDAGPVRVAVEHLEHTHTYPTLEDRAGRSIADHGARTTALVAVDTRVASRPLSFLSLFQDLRRSHAGAEYRFPESMTSSEVGDAVTAQLKTELYETAELKIDAALGWGWRRDTTTPHRAAPFVSDVESEWLWLHRPIFGEVLERQRWDLSFGAHLGGSDGPDLRAVGSYQTLTSATKVPTETTALTFDRAAAAEHRSVSVTYWDTSDTAREWLRNMRLEVAGAPHLGGLRLAYVAAVDYDGAGADQGSGLDYLSPAVGVSAHYSVSGFDLFAVLRREPVPLTAQVTEFLDSARPSSLTYEWQDDGDGVPEPGEHGRLLSRDGGKSHVKGDHLMRSGSNQAAVGVAPPTLGPVRLRLSGLFHVIDHPYTVRLVGPAAASYARGSVGETTVYGRLRGTEGQEVYALENVERPAYFAGAELQVSADLGVWFATFGATGYVSFGATPFGIFADRNDIGVIDSGTADPNQRINSRGSVDAGRAYHVKLMTGVRPLEGLSGVLVVRYQDGESITRLIVVEGLPQGPTAIMAARRGDPVPRLTFHMTVDCRVRYVLPTPSVEAAVVLDGFNLLGSGTEIGEVYATGSALRQATEMVPGRAFLLSLEGKW